MVRLSGGLKRDLPMKGDRWLFYSVSLFKLSHLNLPGTLNLQRRDLVLTRKEWPKIKPGVKRNT